MGTTTKTFGEDSSFMNILENLGWDMTFFFYKKDPFDVFMLEGKALVGKSEEGLMGLDSKYGATSKGYTVAVYDRKQDDFFFKPA